MTFSMYFMDTGTSSSTSGLDEFIALDDTSGLATIDSSGYISGPPYILPSYRQVGVKSCNGVYVNQCSTHTMPIMMFDPDHVDATKTTQTRATPCLAKSEYPKVLSDSTLKDSAFTGMHID